MALQQKRASFMLKAADIGADGSFVGNGSVMNVCDSGGDIIEPGTFVASLKTRKASGDWPRMLLEHNPGQPIGIWNEIYEEGANLVCKGRLVLDVPEAKTVYALMKAGHPYGLSIGYETLAESWCAAADVEQKYGGPGMCMPSYLPSGQVRVITEVDLWEVSVVTFPMNVHARVEAVKAAAASTHPVDMSAVSAAASKRDAALRRLLQSLRAPE
ncbi:MAG: HK97 family phage prohead protease [Hyphomicrobiaceae bacterium]